MSAEAANVSQICVIGRKKNTFGLSLDNQRSLVMLMRWKEAALDYLHTVRIVCNAVQRAVQGQVRWISDMETPVTVELGNSAWQIMHKTSGGYHCFTVMSKSLISQNSYSSRGISLAGSMMMIIKITIWIRLRQVEYYNCGHQASASTIHLNRYTCKGLCSYI